MGFWNNQDVLASTEEFASTAVEEIPKSLFLEIFNLGLAWSLHATFTSLAVGGGIYGIYRAHTALKKGKRDGHYASVGETIYGRSHEINPLTGHEYVDQMLRTKEHMINLEEIFHPSVRKKLMKYIDKAKDLCTEDEPFVFKHLIEVVKPEDQDKVFYEMGRGWVGFFAARLNKHDHLESLMPDDERMIYETVFPALVYEKTAAVQQYRVLYMPLKMLDVDYYQSPLDLRLERGGKFVSNLSDTQNLRMHTNRSVAETINQSRDRWMRYFSVQVATGKTVKIDKECESLIVLPGYVTPKPDAEIYVSGHEI